MKFLLTAIFSFLGAILYAQDNKSKVASPISHAPIGVMGDHMHGKGEIMFSYRFMSMSMKGNLIGSDEVSPETIATSIPNTFSAMQGMPPTLRVVPTDMNMNMHMLGIMYAPFDWMTLMAMGMYLKNEMNLATFQGGMGPNVLGSFSTNTSGFGDLKLSALIKLLKKEGSSLHLNVGLSLPTGSIKESGQILSPMNMMPTVRVPYPMQLGSGSVDFLPGITYSSHSAKIGWGAQFSSTIRLAKNSEDYKFGNICNATAWTSYVLTKWLSTSVRSKFSTLGRIKGMDDSIRLPVQTAHIDFQGGKLLDLGIGFNLIGQSGFVENQRLSIEYAKPIYQNLNGPQMKITSSIMIGWQYAI